MNDQAPKIDKNVPLPDTRRKWPFIEMEVGDSFWVDRPTGTFTGIVGAAAARIGHKYTCRAENGGCRVWRIK